MATQISGSLITRNYKNFSGVDFSSRGDEVSLNRSPDALNMWKNYSNKVGKCVETRPDTELYKKYDADIHGLFFYEYNNVDHLIVHSGTKLYDGTNAIYSSMAEHKSNYFVYDSKLYIMDSNKYLVYDGTTISEVEGYVPTTSISRSPAQGGVIHEDVNLLTPYRRNTFCADGESTEYHLDAQNIDEEQVRVWIREDIDFEEVTTGFTTNYEKGIVTFTTAPSVPLTDGEDNVMIQYKKTREGYRQRIENCTLLEVFDNRVFFSGNNDYPNVLFHCSLNGPTYISDLDYYEEGTNDSAIRALVAGNNAIWVMKEPSQSNTTIFYHNPTIDSDYGKIYPSTHSSISTGCQTTGINFNDTICFFSDNGMEAISGDVTTEQAIAHRSTFIDNRLLNEEKYDDMFLTEWAGYLLVVIGNKIYLADSRTRPTVNNHYEYEWFYWEMDKEISNSFVKNGKLYLCSEDTIYTLTKKDTEIESYWTTMQDEFRYPQYQKITNKKGCTVDMEGKEINIYAKRDNQPYKFIKKYINTKGYVVPRIKQKKWKSIQLKFASKKPFSLYSATLESYVGSYVKR